MSIYRAVVEWDRSAWTVRFEGETTISSFRVRALSDVRSRAEKTIYGCVGLEPDQVEVDIQLRLPHLVEHKLARAEQLTEAATTEAEDAIAAMAEFGLSTSDIERICKARWQTPRWLTLTNSEVANGGLDGIPDALGLRWDDHGRMVTVKCRRCVDSTRSDYLEAPANELNAVIYEGGGFCDLCETPLGQDRDEVGPLP